GFAIVDLRWKLEPHGDGAVGLRLESNLGVILGDPIYGQTLAVDDDGSGHGSARHSHSAFDARYFAGHKHLFTGTVRTAGKFQFFVESRGLIAIDQELAFLRREASSQLGDAQSVLTARGIRRNRKLAEADSANGFAIRAL